MLEKFKADSMGETCITHRHYEMHTYRILIEDLGVMDNLRDLVVNGMIIIKCTLNMYDRSTALRTGCNYVSTQAIYGLL